MLWSHCDSRNVHIRLNLLCFKQFRMSCIYMNMNSDFHIKQIKGIYVNY